jgi:hypothetical protein
VRTGRRDNWPGPVRGAAQVRGVAAVLQGSKATPKG